MRGDLKFQFDWTNIEEVDLGAMVCFTPVFFEILCGGIIYGNWILGIQANELYNLDMVYEVMMHFKLHLRPMNTMQRCGFQLLLIRDICCLWCRNSGSYCRILFGGSESIFGVNIDQYWVYKEEYYVVYQEQLLVFYEEQYLVL